MDSDSTGYLIVIAVLMMALAYFSAVAAAFSSVDGAKLRSMTKDRDRRTVRLLRLSAGRERLRVSMLTLDIMLIIAVTAMGACLANDWWGASGAVIAAAVIAVISMLCCVIFGAIGEGKAESLARVSVPALRAMEAVLTPVTAPLIRIKRAIAGPPQGERKPAVTEKEILTMLEEAESAGSIEEEHSELIQKAIGFYDLTAEDVMTPRPQIHAVDASCSAEELEAIFRETEYSRIPVYEEDIDRIAGVISQRDFYGIMADPSKSISECIGPVIFVSTSMHISELLQKMQEMKTHLAIVIDEYGGTEGLVTMEDIIEELVGEIFDEKDAVAARDIMPLQNGSFRVKCAASINRVFEYLGIEEIPDVSTVNGWVVMNLDKLPEKNDTFETVEDGRRMKVRITKADGKKAIEINLRVDDE